MRLSAGLFCLALGFHASSVWSQTLSSCEVTPHPHVSVERLQVEALGQDRVQVHFQTVAGPASDTCRIASENQNEMLVVCAIEHGKIEIRVAGNNSQILLSAEGQSGRMFRATSSMTCR